MSPRHRPRHTRSFTLAAPLALSLLFAGCAVGPDYERPAASLPAQYSANSPAESGTAGDLAVNPQWWTLFGDAELNRLVDAALAENASLRIAVARVEQADAAARETGASLFPAIDAQAGSHNAGLSEKTASWSPASPNVVRQRSASLTLSYELDVWGRLRRANEAARAELLASRYARDSIRLSVAGLVTASYLSLRAFDAQLAVVSDSLASREESARLVQARVEAGFVSPLDQYEADGAVAVSRAQQAELRRSRALVEHQLALLTGQPDLKIGAGELHRLPLPPLPPAGLPAALIEARPDIRQAEQQLIAANANIGVAKAGYYPRFALTGSVGSESQALDDLFTGGAAAWTSGLSLLMPVLDFGRTSARVDQARAINEQSLIAWQNSLQVAYKEVRDALVNLRENHAEEQAQAIVVDNAQKALATSRLRYEAGYSGYLEVLVAQRSANEAQLALIATRRARLNAAVDLFKALGGGWQPDAS